MDFLSLKKRINTYRTPAGKITGVSDEVLGDLLKSWEEWPGKTKEFAKEVGLTVRQAVILIEKSKKRVREGAIHKSPEFQEVSMPGLSPNSLGVPGTMEMVWDKGRLIRFSQVQQLVEFLKAVA